jgi:CRP-like cAMP-binding protein
MRRDGVRAHAEGRGTVSPDSTTTVLIDALRGTPLFAAVPEPLLEEVAAASALYDRDTGTTLFRAGEPADAMFVVLSGGVDVLDDDGAVIHHLGPGAGIGELGAILERPRSATVVTSAPTQFVRVPQDRVLVLLRTEHDFAVALVQSLAALLWDEATEPSSR